MKNQIFLSLIFIAFNISALGQDNKIDTDRPDQTESPYTIPKQWIQLEAGLNYQTTNEFIKEYLHPTLLSKYGITKGLEFRLITTYKTNSYLVIPNGTVHETGLDPVEIGFKLGLFEEKNFLPKTSLIFHVAVPGLASEKFDIDKVAPNFRFTMQHSLSKKVSLGYNLGAGWDGENNKISEFIYTLAPGFNIGEKWYAYAELFGSLYSSDPPQHNFDAGIAYFVSNDFKVDFSGGIGISAAAPASYVAVGASVRFRTFKKK